jgi:hypothetical protein
VNICIDACIYAYMRAYMRVCGSMVIINVAFCLDFRAVLIGAKRWRQCVCGSMVIINGVFCIDFRAVLIGAKSVEAVCLWEYGHY